MKKRRAHTKQTMENEIITAVMILYFLIASVLVAAHFLVPREKAERPVSPTQETLSPREKGGKP